MNHRLWVTAVIVLSAAHILLVGRARADMGPGLNRNIDIRLRFENLDDYPAYDFYLKYGLGTGNPTASLHMTRVYPATTMVLEGKGNRLTEVYLLAVPHGQSVPPLPSPDVGNWLSEHSGDTQQSAPLPRGDWRLTASDNGYSVRYRVSFAGNHLDVTCVEAVAPKGWAAILADVGSVALIGVVGAIVAVAALFLAVAMGAGGIWLASWSKNQAAPSAARWFLSCLGVALCTGAVGVSLVATFQTPSLWALAAALFLVGIFLEAKALQATKGGHEAPPPKHAKD